MLTIEDLTSSALFHVIGTKTSYHLLLRLPWLHEAGVPPSSWHQCFKYYHDEVQKSVVVEDKSFTKIEAYFANAKFYEKKETIPEALLISMPSFGKIITGGASSIKDAFKIHESK